MNLPLLLIGLLLLGSAAAAMLGRNLIHSALLLVGTWAGIAGFYLWAGAEFLAFAQVLVYVGAVSMVVLFAVILTRQGRPDVPVDFITWQRGIIALIVAGGVAGILVGAIMGSPLDLPADVPPATLTVHDLGLQLMGPHAGALLIAGVLLTVALLGGIIIASVDRPAVAPPPPAQPEDSA